MRVLLFLSLFLIACTASTPPPDGPGRVSCYDNRKLCYEKAAKLCPGGYSDLREEEPTHTGNYSANHHGMNAIETLVYHVTFACKPH